MSKGILAAPALQTQGLTRIQLAMLAILERWPGITRTMLGAHTRQYARNIEEWNLNLSELVSRGRITECYEHGFIDRRHSVTVYYPSIVLAEQAGG